MTMLSDIVKHEPVQMKQTPCPVKWNADDSGPSPWEVLGTHRMRRFNRQRLNPIVRGSGGRGQHMIDKGALVL